MQVFVKTITGRTRVMEVHSNDTGATLKARLCDMEGVPTNKQRIVHASKELQDDCLLSLQGVEPDSELQLALPLLGGLFSLSGLFGSSNASSFLNATSTVLNQYMFNQMVTVVNQNTALCKTGQTINLVVGPTGVINCPTITLSNTNQNNCSLSAIFNTTQNTNITQIATNALNQAITQNQTVNQQFLSLASSMNVSSTTLQQNITNFLQQTLTTNITNNCIVNSTTDQNQNVTVNGTINCSCTPSTTTATTCGANGSLMIGNNSQTAVLSSCVSNNVISLLSTQNTANTATTNATQATTVTQQGLFQGLASFFTGLFSGPLGVILIIVLVIAIVGGVIYGFTKLKSKSQPATTMYMSPGALAAPLAAPLLAPSTQSATTPLVAPITTTPITCTSSFTVYSSCCSCNPTFVYSSTSICLLLIFLISSSHGVSKMVVHPYNDIGS